MQADNCLPLLIRALRCASFNIIFTITDRRVRIIAYVINIFIINRMVQQRYRNLWYVHCVVCFVFFCQFVSMFANRNGCASANCVCKKILTMKKWQIMYIKVILFFLDFNVLNWAVLL